MNKRLVRSAVGVGGTLEHYMVRRDDTGVARGDGDGDDRDDDDDDDNDDDDDDDDDVDNDTRGMQAVVTSAPQVFPQVAAGAAAAGVGAETVAVGAGASAPADVPTGAGAGELGGRQDDGRGSGGGRGSDALRDAASGGGGSGDGADGGMCAPFALPPAAALSSPPAQPAQALSGDGGGAGADADADGRREIERPEDITASLEEGTDVLAEVGEFAELVQAVHERLRLELSGKAADAWLTKMLKEEAGPGNPCWRIPASRAHLMRKLLKLSPASVPAYYHDIYVWLPDVQYDEMPPCPFGCGSGKVGAHGFRSDHFGRRVIELDTYSFIISRRYICHICKQACVRRKAEQADLEAAAAAFGLDVVDDAEAEALCGPPEQRRTSARNTEPPDESTYTFMGWDARSLWALPYHLGTRFPAFLTHRAGVSKTIIDLMRPLMDKGVRPDALSSTLLELHTKRYFIEQLQYEASLYRDKVKGVNALNRGPPAPRFSSFGNIGGYAGAVPTGSYLAVVYKEYAETIATYLANEVKKRPAKWLAWDASYKEAKRLAKHKGKQMYVALITATNELGEVRFQFHVVTDGHDQMKPAISAFLDTAKKYGQQEPSLVFTDKPDADKAFFFAQFPSLRAQQAVFDSLLPPPASDPLRTACALVAGKHSYKVCTTPQMINTNVNALRSLALSEGGVIGLDAEWPFTTSQTAGTQQGKVALIQLACITDARAGSIHALLLRVSGKPLPQAVLALLADAQITFVGRGISADLAKIGRDFPGCSTSAIQAARDKAIDLGPYACQRGVINRSTASLADLTALTLNERLDKPADVRCSDWAAGALSERQFQYAALDVIKTVEVHAHLSRLPDLTLRLAAAAAIVGLRVDIGPRHGSMAALAARAAVGVIMETTDVASPAGCQPARMKPSDAHRVVRVLHVFAPALIVRNLKRADGENVTLESFGSAPFTIMLPLAMLKPARVDSDEPCTAARAATPAADLSNAADLTAAVDLTGLVGIAPVHPTPLAFAAASTSADPPSPGSDERQDDEPANERCGDGDYAEHDGGEGQADSEALSAEALRAWLTAIALAAAPIRARSANASTTASKLSPPPDGEIADVYSAVLGDGFHFIDRAKVPMTHPYKKGYFVAMRDAWYAWDPIILEKVKASLRESGLTEDDIAAKQYFNVAFFRERVPRVVLPPSALYWRVRAVYETFGPAVDSDTGKPLFNDAAWAKADNVLKEIVSGHASDPPGFVFYTQVGSYRFSLGSSQRRRPRLTTVPHRASPASRPPSLRPRPTRPLSTTAPRP
jgi:hypothetical protein